MNDEHPLILAYDELKNAFLEHQRETSIKVENLEKRLEQYKHAYEAIVFQVKELNRQRFGRPDMAHGAAGRSEQLSA